MVKRKQNPPPKPTSGRSDIIPHPHWLHSSSDSSNVTWMESVKIDWRNFSTSGGPNSHTHGPLMVTRMVVLATFCSFRLGHAKSVRFVGSWGTIYNKLMWDEQIFKETPFWGEDFQSKWHPENNWILFTKSKKKVHNTQPAECPHIYDKLYKKSTTFFNICWNSWAAKHRQITLFLHILHPSKGA